MAHEKMNTWRLEVTMSVSDGWVTDGFDLSERTDKVQAMFLDMLAYAYSGEVEVAVTVRSAPKQSHIKKLQGY